MQPWPELQEPLCQLLSSYAGHHDIGEEKIDWLLRVFDQLDRFFAAFRFDHLVAVGLEKLSSQFAQSLFVFDDENCFTTFCELFLMRFLVPQVRSLADTGKVDTKRRTVSHFAIGHDVAVVLLHDAVHSGQPEPSSSSLRLRGEERLKNPRHGLRVHAGAGVADYEHYKIARLSG